jgi:hypothetical protein
MRILFQLGYPGLLRMFGSTVRELSARGHVVLLAYDLPDKKRSPAAEEIEALPGVEIVDPVPWSGSGTPADVQRRSADYLRYLDRRFAGTPYRGRLERKTPPEALEFARKPWARLRAKPYVRALVWRDRFRPPDVVTLEYVRAARPDVIVVTPLISRGEWGARQTETVKSAKDLGIPVAAAIGSWDHLTTKGIVKVVPDRVILWNGIQRREAVRLHKVPRRRIVVTGAQPFDQWFAQEPLLERDEFLASVQLDPARPYLLYAGSSPNITPAEREIPFVEDWLRRLRAAASPLRDLGVLIRPHPGNMDSWAEVDLSALGARVAPRERPGIPMDEADEALYFHSIHFATAIVGINTSAIIEALIQRRPVFTIRMPEFAQEDTLHFRYLLPAGGGCVKLATTMDEHVAQLEEALADPDRERAEIERFLRAFVRPHGLDLPATPFVADAIEHLDTLPRRRALAARLAFSGGFRARHAKRRRDRARKGNVPEAR